jgi:uncharacterized membrane protein
MDDRDMQLSSLRQITRTLKPKPRLLISLSTAALVFLFMPKADWQMCLLVTWNSGTFCFLALVWLMMIQASSETTLIRAQYQEANHTAIFLLSVLVACTSLFVIGAILTQHKDTFNSQVGLSVAAIFSAWLLLHTLFTLHYARFFYRPDPENPVHPWAGGLQFTVQNDSLYLPKYLDFVYFTFTLGMTSQTSDTLVVCPRMRRLVLGHTLISFFFYSVILALTVSVVSGLI